MMPKRVEVICDTCTREHFRIAGNEELHVWVRLADDEKPVKPVKPRKARVKQVTCSVCRKKGHAFMACPLVTVEPLI